MNVSLSVSLSVSLLSVSLSLKQTYFVSVVENVVFCFCFKIKDYPFLKVKQQIKY